MPEDTPDPSAAATAGVDYRQVSFVALAAIALVLAALVAPGFVGSDGSNGADGEGGDGTGGAGERSDEPTDPAFDWTDLLELLGWDAGPPDEPGGGAGEPACTVFLADDPTPGDEVTVTIHYRDEPLADAAVWFNDRRVGRTDASGRVTGTVPYAETLEIRVETDGGVDCLAAETTGTVSVDRDAGEGTETGVGSVSIPTAAMLATATQESDPESDPEPGDGDAENSTVAYEVDGEVAIEVRGEPDPGAEITVAAAVDDVPMRAADVSIDGERVAETDDRGTAAVTVPDDGTERIELTVARGDFAGSTTVDVRLLEATLAPDGLAPIPGSDGVVVAEIADEPAADAEVAVAGEPTGTTDADGRLALRLPRDPTATVTVSTADRTARTSLADAYGALALLSSLLVAGLAAVSYRTHGGRGPVAVAGAAAAGLAVLVVEAFYGPAAGGAALAAASALGVGAVLVGSDRSVATDARSTRRAIARAVERLAARVLAIVRFLEALLDRFLGAVDRLGRWLAALPRSGTELARRLAAWLAALPTRAVAVGRRVLESVRGIRRRPRRAAGAAAGVAGFAAGGYALGGRTGALAAATAFAVGAGVAIAVRSTTDEPLSDAIDERDRSGADAPEPTETDADGHRSVRTAWRAFASDVAPDSWRTRAPAEIERRALAEGYPREAVRELTALFRAIEYGDREPSAADRERATAASERLAGADDGGDAPADATDTDSARDAETASRSAAMEATEATEGDDR